MSPIYVPGKVVLKKDGVAATDTNIREVSLLLHGNGTNGSTTITDSSLTPKTVTAVGNAQISTAIADPFGDSTKGILRFNANTDYFRTPVNTAFAFGSGDYTIEAWLYMTSVTGYKTIFASGNSDGTGVSANYGVYVNGGTSLEIFNNGVGPVKINIPVSISANTWRFISISRSSSITYVHVGGILAGSGTDSFSYASSSNVRGSSSLIGRDDELNAALTFAGYMDDVRITKGVARYGSSNYSIPAAPFPDF
jgi:hypothetical protein